MVTDSVYSARGRMFAQVWHVGRVSHAFLQQDSRAPVGDSDRSTAGALAYARDDAGSPVRRLVATSQPRALSTDEVRRVVGNFARAAPTFHRHRSFQVRRRHRHQLLHHRPAPSARAARVVRDLPVQLLLRLQKRDAALLHALLQSL